MKQLSLSALLILATLASCKKDDDDEPVITPTTPTCRVTSAVVFDGSDSTTTQITYNSDGRISSVNEGGDITTFAYSGNSIYVADDTRKDTVTTNSNGLIAERRGVYFASGGSNYRTRAVYTYNGTELQRAVTYSEFGGALDSSVTTYTWSGGNRISEISDGSTSTFQFSDRVIPATGGDIFAFSDFVEYGAYTIKNKNLTQSAVIQNFFTLNFNYEYDAAGRVSKATISGPGFNASARFTYTCQ